jgi:hypothetical protein
MQTNPAAKMLAPAIPRSAPRELQIRECAFHICCDPPPEEPAHLLTLSENQWKPLLHWLDTSGLALYLLDRLIELDLHGSLPPQVLARLQQNLSDNAKRIEAMAAESVAIQQRLQQSGLSYAVLKGFSLSPVSVPKPHLRSQLDHDFLVAEKDADEAKRILENFGYQLQIKSGLSWEFKADTGYVSSLKNLYKPGMSRVAELHLESPAPGVDSMLARRQTMPFRGIAMPVLSPADLFIGQGLHVFKHVCSAFSRAAHLVEFQRHIVARYHDAAFWEEIRAKCADRPDIGLRLGVAIRIASSMLGPFAPLALTAWTVSRLPSPVVLWIDTYGPECVLASFPGNKLYLLLESELAIAGVPTKRPVGESLLPRRLPPVMPARTGETARESITRRYRRLHYVLFRLRFHAVEGLRFAIESRRWQRMRNRITP